jgi:putative ABC transport system substrate-binding protein
MRSPLNQHASTTPVAGVAVVPLLPGPLRIRRPQPALPMIGFLSCGTAATWLSLTEEFRTGLRAAGYSEGQDVLIEYRWAEGQHDRLPVLAAELMARRVDVIAASAGTAAALAAQALNSSIPIVFTGGGAPCDAGLLESASFMEIYRQAGVYTGLILRGAKVADLAVARSAKVPPERSRSSAQR